MLHHISCLIDPAFLKTGDGLIGYDAGIRGTAKCMALARKLFIWEFSVNNIPVVYYASYNIGKYLLSS